MRHLREQTETAVSSPTLHWLLTGLCWLDRLLECAVEAAGVAYGPEAAADVFRGLHYNAQDIAHLLSRSPGAPPFASLGDFPRFAPEESSDALIALERSFRLTSFDWCILLIALAPEIDLRYERLYAYLQDDVTRKRPTVDLVLNLLCRTVEDRWAARRHFTPNAPLIRHQLLFLTSEPNTSPSSLARSFAPNPQITRYLLGLDYLDERLAPCCSLLTPQITLDTLPVSADLRRMLQALARSGMQDIQQLRLYFHGAPGSGRKRAGEALAGALGRRLLRVDLGSTLAVGEKWVPMLPLLFLEAWSHNALLYLDGWETIREDPQASATFWKILTEGPHNIGVILAGEQLWAINQENLFLPLVFPPPDAFTRRDCWRRHLTAFDIPLAEEALTDLVDRFRLYPEQIASAIRTARQHARRRALSENPETAPQSEISLSDLFAGAREQSGHTLDGMACKLTPVYTWKDIVLPTDSLAQLREMCQWVTYRQNVLETWGFGRKLSQGKGINALFVGPSGTGKTMAAEIIANALELELYKIDLSGVVSKYIGETEKNLDRIFVAAESANAILFFDEADALFGKRSEVRDSHDRYANVEISYLLQKMEQHEGIAILATNLRGNLDEAFVRRLAFVVHFPFPEEPERRRIWEGIWPDRTLLAEDVDLDVLTRRFKVSGGNIKNVALAAAYLAAQEGSVVTMAHLLHAIRREYQKLGKVLSDAELGRETAGSLIASQEASQS